MSFWVLGLSCIVVLIVILVFVMLGCDCSSPRQTKKTSHNQYNKAKKEAQKLIALYEQVYWVDTRNKNSKNSGVGNINNNEEHGASSNISKKQIKQILNQLIHYTPTVSNRKKKKNKDKNGKNSKNEECQVCFMKYNNNSRKRMKMKGDCDHSMICKTCFEENLKIKIKNDDCVPWLLCPAFDCKAKIDIDLIVKHTSIHDLYHFAAIFILRHLRRNENWIECQTKNCHFGWNWNDIIVGKPKEKRKGNNKKQFTKLKCQSCNKMQNIRKSNVIDDLNLSKLLKSGEMRKCPKCEWPTMKDYGLCNIMHCDNCDIFWNWNNGETGNSSKELKNRARIKGTLWEPGELAYQQNLQRNNLPEFIKLLQRNGIKYDPNYRRGT